FLCCALRNYANCEPPQRIIAASIEAHIGEPDRPQTAGRLSEEMDDALDDHLGRRGGHDRHEQCSPIASPWLNLIQQSAEAFAVDAAEGEHQACRSAKNELRSRGAGEGLINYGFRRGKALAAAD